MNFWSSMIRSVSINRLIHRYLIDQQYRTLFQCLLNYERSFSSKSNNGTTDEDEVDLSIDESADNTEEEEESSNPEIKNQTSKTESAFASNQGLSFFEGGTGFGHLEKKLKKDPLNIEVVHVPWVEDWFRTRQGYARINLIAEKTKLTPDEVQKRLSRILSLAPGLQEMIPLLHPTLFSSIISNISHSFEVMTMLKAELPAIDLGILVSGYPPILTWNKKVIRDCLCFLVVHFKGRTGAANALNEHPTRLKYLRMMLPVLFVDHEAEKKREARLERPLFLGRLYHFKSHRKKASISLPTKRLLYFEREPPLRE